MKTTNDGFSDYAALITHRENLYHFLARLYRVEVDPELMDGMASMSFPFEGEEKELIEGYRMLDHYLRNPGLDTLTDLAVDFAKVFIGAGVSETGAAYPYESVYTSPGRLIMQEARDQVVAIYRANGFDKIEALDIPEDHIALELEFMAGMCNKMQVTLAEQDWKAVSAHLDVQRKFLNTHLLNWVPTFCADILKYAVTDFYKAIAKITNGYLLIEQRIIENLITVEIH